MTIGIVLVLATPCIICAIGILFSQPRPPRHATTSTDRRVANQARKCLEEMDAELASINRHLSKTK